MKKMLKTLVAVALTSAIAYADDTASTGTDQKDLKKVIQDQGINYVETAQKGITLSGYVDTSYTYQFAGAGEYGSAGTNPGGGVANAHAALRQFDTSNNDFNINAVKIALEKALPDKNDWAAGFRIDAIYGSDAKYLGDSAFNGADVKGTGTDNNSGLALEQALVKFRAPVGNGLDFYVGKFVTFLGYEVIESPANPNFSRGLLFTNAIPLTHTGAYADYKFNDTFEAKLGIVDDWNNSTSSSSARAPLVGTDTFGNTTTTTFSQDKTSFGKAITGQLNVNAPGKNANITTSFIYSPEGEEGVVGNDNGPVVVGDIWGNWQPTFIKDSALTLGFNLDFGYSGATDSASSTATTAAFGGDLTDPALGTSTSTANNDTNTWYGAALYAQYKFNKVFSLNGRGEYLHEDAALIPKFGTGTFAGNPTDEDDFSYTLTANFSIWDNLLTRVEYRVDDLAGPATGGTNSLQHEISLNAVYSF